MTQDDAAWDSEDSQLIKTAATAWVEVLRTFAGPNSPDLIKDANQRTAVLDALRTIDLLEALRTRAPEEVVGAADEAKTAVESVLRHASSTSRSLMLRQYESASLEMMFNQLVDRFRDQCDKGTVDEKDRNRLRGELLREGETLGDRLLDNLERSLRVRPERFDGLPADIKAALLRRRGHHAR